MMNWETFLDDKRPAIKQHSFELLFFGSQALNIIKL